MLQLLALLPDSRYHADCNELYQTRDHTYVLRFTHHEA